MKTAFGNLLADLKDYPLLSAEEEKELARKTVAGDVEAREKFINSNIRLVISIAKKYSNRHLTINDLVNEGVTGLIKAVDTFNPELGYRFSTYASYWIKQAIGAAITEQGKNIRVPAHIYQQLRKLRQVEEELSKEGNTPTDEEIAEALKITPEKYNQLLQYRNDTVSLSTPLGDDSEDTLADLQADTHRDNPEQIAVKSGNAEAVLRLLEDLPERTRTIIKMRYGIAGTNDPVEFRTPHTLEEVGAYLGITRERVRQIEKQTLLQLKTSWNGLF